MGTKRANYVPVEDGVIVLALLDSVIAEMKEVSRQVTGSDAWGALRVERARADLQDIERVLTRGLAASARALSKSDYITR